MKNKYYSVLLIFAVVMLLTSCSQGELKGTDANAEGSEEIIPYQIKPPKEGDEIVVVETELGSIKFKLFGELSPQYVKVFKGYVGTDYYSNASFDRIEQGIANQIAYRSTFAEEEKTDVMLPYPYEDAPNLKNIKGAVCLIYQVDEFVSPSLAFVIGSEVTQEEIDLMSYLGEESYSKEIIELYQKEGGLPSFDGLFTVIGQVYEGFDVVEAINQLPVKASDENKTHHVPITPFPIKSFTIEVYK